MMRIGLLGMRRRIVDYDPALGFDFTHLILTIAGYLIGISVMIFIYNFFNSIKNGEKAEGNVWNSRSPEWQVPRRCRRTTTTVLLKWLENRMIRSAWLEIRRIHCA